MLIIAIYREKKREEGRERERERERERKPLDRISHLRIDATQKACKLIRCLMDSLRST